MFKDYIVLLFGLTISIAIFYMFQTLAQNEAFVKANSIINSIMFIFQVGTIILGFITIFYIFYATSFIQTLRQKEMAMYMTLGAKKSKITQLMFMETLFIGIISLAIGLILGFGLTTVVTDLLMEKLNFSAEAEGFKAIYTKSILTTVIFYVALFILTSIVNAWQIGRKKVLDLLQANQKQDVIKTNGIKTFLGVVTSVILIAIAYYIFINMVGFKSTEMKKIAVLIITGTVIPGTFLMLIYLLPFLIKKLKKNRMLNETGINSFTLGQLRFRMLHLTKVLGTVAMLIALGLGAMTAGISFYHNAGVQTSKLIVNDIAVYQPTKKDMDMIKTMKLTEKNTYTYKLTDDNIYFLKSNLLEQPPFIPDTTGIEKLADVKRKRVASKLPASVYSIEDEKEEMLPEDWASAISGELKANFDMFGPRTIYVVDENHFQKINAKEAQVILVRTDDFTKYLPTLKKLEERQKKIVEQYTGAPPEYFEGKYTLYTSLYQVSSGTIFMGVFLGIAFLMMMMMASVLMFKLLSSARADIGRYHMLRKIGVRKKLLERSIYRELFLLFLFPAIVGFAHVLVGMQAFAIILIEPYTKIWLPISIFILIYGIYYVITVQLYKRIVLPKQM
ncbi:MULTISPECIES: FtsX-like permease family protein [Clostridia]|uniref:FtsX-like permease family protein n=1 Tax=Clostridia TaxID=186801 RepID=UPI0018F5D0D4|nr:MULTISPECIES: FtsX-like permease family protein [Clostridia]